MSNFLQTLFNTNHDQPSFLVFVVLAILAIVVPNLSKYLYESRRARNAPHTTSGFLRPEKEKEEKTLRIWFKYAQEPHDIRRGALAVTPSRGAGPPLRGSCHRR